MPWEKGPNFHIKITTMTQSLPDLKTKLVGFTELVFSKAAVPKAE